MGKLTKVQMVDKIHRAPIGSFRIVGKTPSDNPADGMRAMMAMGDGAYMDIPNPRYEWQHGLDERAVGGVLALIASYDYLLSSHIPVEESIRRLRLLRAGRRALSARALDHRGDELGG